MKNEQVKGLVLGTLELSKGDARQAKTKSNQQIKSIKKEK